MKTTTIFAGRIVGLDSPLGEIAFGIVDPHAPGVAEGISTLLMRSIQDAREETGGHLPSWLVDDIERNYISPERVRTLWAETGHRFALVMSGEIVGTIHVAREHDVILTIDRTRINVPAREHPGFKPERFHHVVNLSVKHELRRAGLGTSMVDGIIEHFRDLFDGDGLWVRADPPWHDGLVGLGFAHDPARDVFLPESAVRTAGLTHAEFNQRHACACAGSDAPERAKALETNKLQYVSFQRPFTKAELPKRYAAVTSTFAFEIKELHRKASERGASRTETPLARAHDPTPTHDTPDHEASRAETPLAHASAPIATRDASSASRTARRTPFRPSSVAELADFFAFASREKRRVGILGRGFGFHDRAPSDDLVVVTEGLDRVGAPQRDRVTVGGGAPLEAVLRATHPLGLAPPVLTSWLPASVGGVLSTGGFGKGSHIHGFMIDHVRALVVVTGNGRIVECSRTQAAWLFEAVLGGRGTFGVIAEATLDLVPSPARLKVETKIVDAGDVAAALDEPDAFHVAAFGADAHGATRTMTIVRAAEAEKGVSFLEYVARPRDLVRVASQLAVPRTALAETLRVLPTNVAVHPVRQLRRHAFLPTVEGQHLYIVSVFHRERLDRSNGVAALFDPYRFRSTGAQRAKALADPSNVLPIEPIL